MGHVCDEYSQSALHASHRSFKKNQGTCSQDRLGRVSGESLKSCVRSRMLGVRGRCGSGVQGVKWNRRSMKGPSPSSVRARTWGLVPAAQMEGTSCTLSQHGLVWVTTYMGDPKSHRTHSSQGTFLHVLLSSLCCKVPCLFFLFYYLGCILLYSFLT